MHPTSAYTAACQDLQDGIVDMSVGNFWVTAQRLKMTSFTLPLFYDKTVLVIKNPAENESFFRDVGKVLMPFTPRLWVLVIATVVVSSLFGVWFSERPTVAPVPGGPPRRRRKSAYIRLAIDSCLQKSIFFCSAGVEQDGGATLSSKLLMAGFGSIILTRRVVTPSRISRRWSARSHVSFAVCRVSRVISPPRCPF